MLFQVYDVSHAKKCKVRKVRGSQNGDFIDIKNDLVCKSRDRLKPKSAICFLPVSLDPGERYSCCANITSLAHVGSKSAGEGVKLVVVYEMDKIF